MKRIIKSKLDDHVIDLYDRIDDVKKEICVIKNNHLKHLSFTLNKLENKVDKLYWSIFIGMGSLILTFIGMFGNFLK